MTAGTTMQVVVEHEGDERSSGDQCQAWRLDDTPELEEWPHTDKPLSKLNGVERLYQDKLDQHVFELAGDDEVTLPNVAVVEVTLE